MQVERDIFLCIFCHNLLKSISKCVVVMGGQRNGQRLQWRCRLWGQSELERKEAGVRVCSTDIRVGAAVAGMTKVQEMVPACVAEGGWRFARGQVAWEPRPGVGGWSVRILHRSRRKTGVMLEAAAAKRELEPLGDEGATWGSRRSRSSRGRGRSLNHHEASGRGTLKTLPPGGGVQESSSSGRTWLFSQEDKRMWAEVAMEGRVIRGAGGGAPVCPERGGLGPRGLGDQAGLEDRLQPDRRCPGDSRATCPSQASLGPVKR